MMCKSSLLVKGKTQPPKSNEATSLHLGLFSLVLHYYSLTDIDKRNNNKDAVLILCCRGDHWLSAELWPQKQYSTRLSEMISSADLRAQALCCQYQLAVMVSCSEYWLISLQICDFIEEKLFFFEQNHFMLVQNNQIISICLYCNLRLYCSSFTAIIIIIIFRGIFYFYLTLFISINELVMINTNNFYIVQFISCKTSTDDFKTLERFVSEYHILYVSCFGPSFITSHSFCLFLCWFMHWACLFLAGVFGSALCFCLILFCSFLVRFCIKFILHFHLHHA